MLLALLFLSLRALLFLSLRLAPIQDEPAPGQRDTKRDSEDMSRLSLEFRDSMSRRKSADQYASKGVVSLKSAVGQFSQPASQAAFVSGTYRDVFVTHRFMRTPPCAAPLHSPRLASPVQLKLNAIVFYLSATYITSCRTPPRPLALANLCI